MELKAYCFFLLFKRSIEFKYERKMSENNARVIPHSDLIHFILSLKIQQPRNQQLPTQTQRISHFLFVIFAQRRHRAAIVFVPITTSNTTRRQSSCLGWCRKSSKCGHHYTLLTIICVNRICDILQGSIFRAAPDTN